MKDHLVCATALRVLAIDAIEKAKSGHPGVALGFADVVTVLWRSHLRFDAKRPDRLDRDRFVFSNGHASALYYALLHLVGFDISLADLASFRQLGSITPGHPERDPALGIDVATGPLGQGLANAVGMAMAKSFYQDRRPDFPDYFVYAMVGDGCLMEGISHEACSLASHFSLGNLIVCWDDNGISIDGSVKGWFAEDVVKRFQAYGWQVIDSVDGHDPEAIDLAFKQAKSCRDRPSLLVCKTKIGYASPWEDKCVVHGKPLGKDGVAAVREKLSWSYPPFNVPDDVYQAWRNRPASACSPWQDFSWKSELCVDAMMQQLMDPTLAAEATRVSSKHCLSFLIKNMSNLLGGSADLSESTGVCSARQAVWTGKKVGSFIHFGVREFAMFAIANGLAATGLRPFVSTFLVFADYGMSAIRMAALMKLPVIFVLTHDSIAVGEDGPTHQPVEQLSHLRGIPNLKVWRPCDRQETLVSWCQALADERNPSCLVLSRQALPQYSVRAHAQIAKGGYRLCEDDNPVYVVLATGSEVSLAVDAWRMLRQEGVHGIVVSLPCMERFLAQPKRYQEQVLPSSLQHRIAIEAGIASVWHAFSVPDAHIIAIKSFGASGKGEDVRKEYGLTSEHIMLRVKTMLAKSEQAMLVTEDPI